MPRRAKDVPPHNSALPLALAAVCLQIISLILIVAVAWARPLATGHWAYMAQCPECSQQICAKIRGKGQQRIPNVRFLELPVEGCLLVRTVTVSSGQGTDKGNQWISKGFSIFFAVKDRPLVVQASALRRGESNLDIHRVDATVGVRRGISH